MSNDLYLRTDEQRPLLIAGEVRTQIACARLAFTLLCCPVTSTRKCRLR